MKLSPSTIRRIAAATAHHVDANNLKHNTKTIACGIREALAAAAKRKKKR